MAQENVFRQPAAGQADRRDFDHPRPPGIETGGLGVDCHGVEGEQQRRIADRGHRLPPRNL